MAETNAPSSQLEREECRALALKYLALRSELAFRLEAVARGLRREFAAEFTDADVYTALCFLRSLGAVKSEHDPMGSTLSWQATAQGVLQHERSGR